MDSATVFFLWKRSLRPNHGPSLWIFPFFVAPCSVARSASCILKMFIHLCIPLCPWTPYPWKHDFWIYSSCIFEQILFSKKFEFFVHSNVFFAPFFHFYKWNETKICNHVAVDQSDHSVPDTLGDLRSVRCRDKQVVSAITYIQNSSVVLFVLSFSDLKLVKHTDEVKMTSGNVPRVFKLLTWNQTELQVPPILLCSIRWKQSFHWGYSSWQKVFAVRR